VFIIPGISTAKRNSIFSADDGDVPAVQADGNSQAITWFDKYSVIGKDYKLVSSSLHIFHPHDIFDVLGTNFLFAPSSVIP
jgi:hypothetical protein